MGASFVRLKNGLSGEYSRLGSGSSDVERLSNGLIKTKVLKYGEVLLKYDDSAAWHQGGEETFIADCKIDYRSESGEIRSRHVIGKALVSMSLPSERLLQTRLQRRSFLSEKGIRVPELYWAQDGLILEEFLEESVPLDHVPQHVLQQIARIAALLDRCGFVTLSFLSDLRMKDDELYYVDFGFDLGDPSTTIVENARHTIESRLVEPYKSQCLRIYDEIVSRV